MDAQDDTAVGPDHVVDPAMSPHPSSRAQPTASVADTPDGVIDAALAALDQSVLEARVYDEKIGMYLAATAAGIRAQRAIGEDYKATSRTLVAAIRKTVVPISAEDIKSLNKAVGQHAAGEVFYAVRQLTHQTMRRTMLWGMVATACLMALSFGAGAWLLQGPAVTCRDQDGGVACGYWLGGRDDVRDTGDHGASDVSKQGASG